MIFPALLISATATIAAAKTKAENWVGVFSEYTTLAECKAGTAAPYLYQLQTFDTHYDDTKCATEGAVFSSNRYNRIGNSEASKRHATDVKTLLGKIKAARGKKYLAFTAYADESCTNLSSTNFGYYQWAYDTAKLSSHPKGIDESSESSWYNATSKSMTIFTQGNIVNTLAADGHCNYNDFQGGPYYKLSVVKI